MYGQTNVWICYAHQELNKAINTRKGCIYTIIRASYARLVTILNTTLKTTNKKIGVPRGKHVSKASRNKINGERETHYGTLLTQVATSHTVTKHIGLTQVCPSGTVIATTEAWALLIASGREFSSLKVAESKRGCTLNE
jgi:hypothetical protein